MYTHSQSITCYAGSSRHELASTSIIWSALRLLRDTCMILITAFLMDPGWPVWTFTKMNMWRLSAPRLNNLLTHCLSEDNAVSGMQFSSWLKQNSMLARFSPQRDSSGSFAQSASCSHLAKVEVTEYRLWISHISQRSGYINAAVAWCLLNEFSWMSYMLLTMKQKESGLNDVML